MYGPTNEHSAHLHATKYRQTGETYDDYVSRVSATLSESEAHRRTLKDILGNMRFLPGGRIQSAIGSPRTVTAFNCFVSGTVEDNFTGPGGIMHRASEAAETMRLGGGIGYDFSRLRPRGDRIKSLDSQASGPVSFMRVYNEICKTIASAGHRRGAQMAVLRVDHPDIEEYITAKHNVTELTGFNTSVAITDAFMEAVQEDTKFALQFEGRLVRYVSARALWEKIMRSTWDWAEPGVLFIDTINRLNPLAYCETLEATNPCGEQPLPPYGACLLGSFNLVKYVHGQVFDYDGFRADIMPVVIAMDHVIENTVYPLPEQAREAKQKRRMGLGVTGLATALSALGHDYGSTSFMATMVQILTTLRDEAYTASARNAAVKGSFPLFDADKYLSTPWSRTLAPEVRDLIARVGLRNSHLLSIAPTGTISMAADNVSSGIEPVFAASVTRTVQTFDGPTQMELKDYGYARGWRTGRLADQCTADDHVKVLTTAQGYVDSAISKTCNVGEDVTWDEFKNLYMEAWQDGAKGCTTFRAAGKRMGILTAKKDAREDQPEACVVDPVTGAKECA